MRRGLPHGLLLVASVAWGQAADPPDEITARGAGSPPAPAGEAGISDDEAVTTDDNDDAALPPPADEEVVIIADEASGPEEALVIDNGDGAETIVIADDDQQGRPEDDPELTLTVPGLGETRTWVTAEVSSRVSFDLNFDTSTREDVVEWWNMGRLRLDTKTGRSFRAIVEGWVRWGVTAEDTKPDADFFLFNARNPKWTGEVQLREGYVEIDIWDFDLKIGQRIFVWGKNEAFAPADVLNPRDLRYDTLQAMSSTKDGKVPVFAFDLSYGLGDTRFQLVVAPFFTSHAMTLWGRDFSLAAPGSQLGDQLQGLMMFHPSIEDQLQGALNGTELPEESFENMSVALRATTSQWGWDFGATVYFGWDRTPELVIDDDLMLLAGHYEELGADPRLAIEDREVREALLRVQQRLSVGEELVSGTFNRSWVFALEAEGTIGDFVLRADVGFTPEAAYYDEDLGYHRMPSLSGAIGGEFTYGAEWYLGLTFLAIGVFDTPAGSLMGLEPNNRPPTSGDAAGLYGCAATVQYLWEEQNLQLQAAGIFTLSASNDETMVDPSDLVVTAEIAYKDWEPHQFKLGAVFIWGQNGSLGHTFQYNDFIYLQYQGAW